MPNSIDGSDQGRRSPGFPSEKPVNLNRRFVAWLLTLGILVACILLLGNVIFPYWLKYVLMLP